MKRKPYESDLADEQWDIIGPIFPPPNAIGRPRADLREIVNAIFYVARAGCS